MPLPPNLQNRGKPKCAAELTQAKALQALAADAALNLRQDIVAASSTDMRVKLARALRDAVSAWDTARDAVRVLRGRGLPRSVLEKPRKSKSKPIAMMDDVDQTTAPEPTPKPPETPTEKEASKESL